METQTPSSKIRLPASPDFCWPVQIRIGAMLTLAAPRNTPDLPASFDVLDELTTDVFQGETIGAAADPTTPNTPDWRISGDQEESGEE